MNNDRFTKQIIVVAVGVVAVLVATTETMLAWTNRGIPNELATLAFGCVTGLLGLLGKTSTETEQKDAG